MNDKRYILIQTTLFTALMRNQLKGFAFDSRGKFNEDLITTLIDLDLTDPPPTRYYILKWRGEKPSSIPPQYSESGNNPRTNKIFNQQELKDFLAVNLKVESLPKPL